MKTNFSFKNFEQNIYLNIHKRAVVWLEFIKLKSSYSLVVTSNYANYACLTINKIKKTL